MPASHAKPPRKPSFSPAWRTPARPLASWPPLEPSQPYDVTDTDTWISIAAAQKFPDPWDIIIFNFRTDVPEEVNWYLHHIMWCTESNDGRNFSFRGCGRRRIHIPRHDWIPDRKYARGSFNSRLIVPIVLRDLEVIIPRLRAVIHRSFVATPFDYWELRDKIADGLLRVRLGTPAELGDAASTYDVDEDEIILSRYNDIRGENDLIHELTHALFDHKRYTARVIDEEIVARIEEAANSFASVGRTLRRRMDHFRRLFAHNPQSSAKFFVGHVISSHLKAEPLIHVLRGLNQEFEHPLTGERANPAHDLALSISSDPGYPDWAEETTGNGIREH